MNNDIRDEMIIVLNSENVCGDCQIKCMSICSKFINNQKYMAKAKELLDLFFENKKEVNFWVELPKIISVIIDLNKQLATNGNIEIDHMKYAIYSIIYSYLDTFQPQLLNSQDQGDLRICFINILGVLLTKPKKIRIIKETLWEILSDCVCGDSDKIRI